MQLLAQLFHAPLRMVAFPVAIKPQQFRLVAFTEFLQLGAVEPQEGFPGLMIYFPIGWQMMWRGRCFKIIKRVVWIDRVPGRWVIGVRPVAVRKIQPDVDVVFA